MGLIEQRVLNYTVDWRERRALQGLVWTSENMSAIHKTGSSQTKGQRFFVSSNKGKLKV